MMITLSKYVAICLGLLALAFAVSETLTFRIAGFKPLARLDAGALAAPEAIEDLAAARFLEERDRVQVEILRDMTLGEFVRLYQLSEQPHVRRQIAAQDGASALPDSHLLKKGRRYQITLTLPAPPAEGTEPAAAPPRPVAGGTP